MHRILLLLLLLSSSNLIGQSLTKNELMNLIDDNRLKVTYGLYIDQPENSFLPLLLSATNSDMSNRYIAALDTHIEELNKINKPTNSKKQLKYIKGIFTKTHDRFLKKYTERAEFHQVFENGTYNCVTACLLYAYILEEMSIPYIIKETLTHVYIVAYPDSNQILIETTDPSGGFSDFSNTYKQNFVQQLAESKMIDATEYNSSSVVELFNKYYFSKDEATLSELVGIQFLNEAIFSYQDQAYLKTIKKTELAYKLYEKEKTKNILVSAILDYLNQEKYKNWTSVKMYTRLANMDSIDFTEENLLDEFQRLTYEVLTENARTDFYDSITKYLATNIQDSSLRDEIAFVHNYESARIAYGRGDYNKSLAYSEILYLLKPKHSNVELLFIGSLQNVLNNERDINDAWAIVLKYKNDYASLMDNKIFGGIYLNGLLLQAKQEIDNRETQKSKELIAEFEATFGMNKDYLYNQNLAGNVYARIGTYYIKKRNYSEAKEQLKKGLEYAPDHYEIRNRLYYID